MAKQQKWRPLATDNITVLNSGYKRDGRIYMCFTAVCLFDFDKPGELLPVAKHFSTCIQALGDGVAYDLSTPKDRGEFFVAGKAHAPGGQAVDALTVHAQVGDVSKSLLVTGDRHWESVVGGVHTISDPKAFTEMPLNYANAFGGKGYEPNPHGKGYLPEGAEAEAAKSDEPPLPRALPNIESKQGLIVYYEDCPKPSYYLPVLETDPERMALFGRPTVEEVKADHPYLPRTAKWSYFNRAPLDQQFRGHWRGDEPILVENMHESEPKLSGQLPGFAMKGAVVDDKDRFQSLEMALDTVWLLPALKQGMLVFHGSVADINLFCKGIKYVLLEEEPLGRQEKDIPYFEAALKRKLAAKKAKMDKVKPPKVPKPANDAVEKRKLEMKAKLKVKAQAVRDANTVMKDRMVLGALAEKPNVSPAAQEELSKIMQNPEMKTALQLSDKQNAEMQALLAEKGTDMSKLISQSEEWHQAYAKTSAEVSPEAAMAELDANLAKVLGKDQYESMMKQALESDHASTQELPTVGEIKAQLLEQDAEVDKHLSAMAAKDPEMQEVLDAHRDSIAKFRQHLDESYGSSPVDKVSDESAAQKSLRDYKARQREIEMARRHGGGSGSGSGSGSQGAGSVQAAAAATASLTVPQILEHARNKQSMANMRFNRLKLSGNQLPEANLAGVDFSEADISGVSFKGANLKGAKFFETKMQNTDFTGADLSGAQFRKVKAKQANFDKANLSGAQIQGGRFEHASFHRTKLEKLTVTKADLSEADFAETTLSGKMTQPTLTGSKWDHVKMPGLVVEQGDFDKAQMAHVDAPGMQMNKSSFGGAKLNTVDFSGMQGERVDFSKASMNHVSFQGSSLKRLGLAGVTGEGVDFSSSMMENVRGDEHTVIPKANFKGNQMEMASFKQSEFPGADFTGAHMDKSYFEGADLSGADFSNASAKLVVAKDANFEGARAVHTNFEKSIFIGANLNDANLQDSNLYGINTMGAQMAGAKNLQDA